MGTILIHPTRYRHDRAGPGTARASHDDAVLLQPDAGADLLSLRSPVGTARARLGAGLRAAPLGYAGSVLIGVATLCVAVAMVAVGSLAFLATATVLLCVIAILTLAEDLLRGSAYAIGLGCAVAMAYALLADPGMPADEGFLIRAIAGLVAMTIAACLAIATRGAARGAPIRAIPIDLAHEAILARDADGLITFWSRGAERLYGWSQGEALGQHADELLRTEAAALFSQVPSTGCWEGDLKRTRRDGHPIVVRSRWSRPSGASGRSVASVEVAIDVTRECETREELDRARADLVHLAGVQTHREFAASIAHEVNQPLTAIVTNGEACRRWLERETIDLGAVRASVDKMIANGRRASEVVACLRSCDSPAVPGAMAFNVNNVVQDVLSLLEDEAAASLVAFRVELDPDLPLVAVGHIELRQVLINLVLNAVQALETVDDRLRVVVMSTWGAHDGQEVGIEVRDNGPGLGHADPERLFDSFYSTKSNGMGMGLSICRSMLMNRGGRIAAKPADEGHGACFTVHLRCGAPQPVPA